MDMYDLRTRAPVESERARMEQEGEKGGLRREGSGTVAYTAVVASRYQVYTTVRMQKVYCISRKARQEGTELGG